MPPRGSRETSRVSVCLDFAVSLFVSNLASLAVTAAPVFLTKVEAQVAMRCELVSAFNTAA